MAGDRKLPAFVPPASRKVNQMTIESFTNPGVSYHIHVDGGVAQSCSCPDHQFRKRCCKHLRAAQIQLKNERERVEKENRDAMTRYQYCYY